MKRNHQGKKNPHHKDGRTNGKRTTLRLPADLKQQIIELLPPGMSQNDYIIEALREKIAQDIKQS